MIGWANEEGSYSVTWGWYSVIWGWYSVVSGPSVRRDRYSVVVWSTARRGWSTVSNGGSPVIRKDWSCGMTASEMAPVGSLPDSLNSKKIF